MEAEKSESKLGIGAYLALIFAIIFFSGLAKNEQFVKMLPDKQWVTAASVFDFGTLNGSFGKVLTSATAKPDGKIETKSGNFRGAGGNGAPHRAIGGHGAAILPWGAGHYRHDGVGRPYPAGGAESR